VLAGYATPYDEGSPAADIPGLVRKFLKPSPKVLKGGASAYKALRAEGAEGAFTILRRIISRHKDESKALLEGLAEMQAKLGDGGVKYIARMARRLGSRSDITRAGQRFVMEAMRPKLAAAASGAAVKVEHSVEIALRGGKKQVRRFYDFVVDDVLYECKNWSIKNWTRFPPPLTNERLYRAYKTAREQFLRDLTNVGGDITKIRWVLPKDFLGRHGGALASDFSKLIESDKFRRYVGDEAAWRAAIARLGGQINPTTGKVVAGSTLSRISGIFVSP
jgi:hypothetical protein